MIKLLIALVLASHAHPESYCQQQWCNDHNGIIEHVLDDKTRVDCLTDTHAIEFDFAPKWAEAVGQSLHYGMKTGKQPGIVLILEKPEHSRYYNRVKPLADRYGITVWTVENTP